MEDKEDEGNVLFLYNRMYVWGFAEERQYWCFCCLTNIHIDAAREQITVAAMEFRIYINREVCWIDPKIINFI